MTTDNTSIINQEATMNALSKILLRAQEATEHDSLIEQLRQSLLCVEGEATSTGQIHARRILSANPDYTILCRMLDEAREMIDEEEDFYCFHDGDPTIADHDFQMDLVSYPSQLQPAMFAGFYAEARRIHSEVTA